MCGCVTGVQAWALPIAGCIGGGPAPTRTRMTATPRNKSMIQKLYDWTMEKSAHPHAEYWLALVSFIEASFFPIPPHPMLGLMCLANPKKAVRYAIICTIAPVAGGLLGYLIGFFLSESAGLVARK